MHFVYLSIIFVLGVVNAWQFFLRKKAERSIRDAGEQIQFREHKIQTILNNAPIVFSAIDSNGIFRISEGKGLEKLGRKNNESIGVSIYEMHKRNPIILDAVSRAFAGEQVATTFQLNNITYDLFIGPERNTHGEITGATMLSVDITDLKRIEEEKVQLLIREQSAVETTRLKSEFLATMSHEIRTPLNGVLGMASLLQDTPLTSEQKEFVSAIKDSGAGLLTVINDILDFSKIEAGKLDFEAIDFNLPDLIHHALNGLNFAAVPKRLSLVRELSPTLPQWVKGDPGRFRQILNNVVANAIKFTEKGQIVIRVSTLPSLPPAQKATIRVEVEDTGIGIAEASLEKMFTAFSQADASMSRRFGGTGLGLSISKQLVDKMGGNIGVTSTLGQGSIFWFTLPFDVGVLPTESATRGTEKSFTVSSANGTPHRILVAEDNLVNQTLTLRLIKKMGCSADLVINGLEAVKALETNDYDLVLMDCQMPIMDGLEATRKIRASTSPRNRGIPILAMTANAMKGDRENCIAAGMDDYVSKPVVYDDLAAAVARWLEIKRQRSS